jgi:hypothetical protein
MIKQIYAMMHELEKHNLSMNKLKIIDGNSKFLETKFFLEQSIQKDNDNDAINCDDVRERINSIGEPFWEFHRIKNIKKYLNQNKEDPLKKEIDEKHRKRFLSFSESEIGQFLKNKEEYNFPDSFDDDFFNTVAQQFYDSVNGRLLT